MTDGYRVRAIGGASVRADIVDVYVFRRTDEASDGQFEFLQLLRTTEPLAQTWHPVMGHVEKDETCETCAVRELEEELGLSSQDRALVGMWALEQTWPYFVKEIDCVVISPRFAALVERSWEPCLNTEHKAYRWIEQRDTESRFLWPGQMQAIREIAEELMRPGDIGELRRARLSVM